MNFTYSKWNRASGANRANGFDLSMPMVIGIQSLNGVGYQGHIRSD
jgi:hypothetical protein